MSKAATIRKRHREQTNEFDFKPSKILKNKEAQRAASENNADLRIYLGFAVSETIASSVEGGAVSTNPTTRGRPTRARGPPRRSTGRRPESNYVKQTTTAHEEARSVKANVEVSSQEVGQPQRKVARLRRRSLPSCSAVESIAASTQSSEQNCVSVISPQRSSSNSQNSESGGEQQDFLTNCESQSDSNKNDRNCAAQISLDAINNNDAPSVRYIDHGGIHEEAILNNHTNKDEEANSNNHTNKDEEANSNNHTNRDEEANSNNHTNRDEEANSNNHSASNKCVSINKKMESQSSQEDGDDAPPRDLENVPRPNSPLLIPSTVRILTPSARQKSTPTFRCSSLPPLSRRQQYVTIRCHYSDDLLYQKIIEAKRMGSKKDYFSGFSDCQHSRRVNMKTRARIMEYLVETGRYIKNPISPFSVHMAISLFDRYMSYLSTDGTSDMKDRAARDIEVVSAACLHLASKVEDPWALCLGDVCQTFEDGAATLQKQVLYWEQNITRDFDFDVNCPTILDFLHWMFELVVDNIIKESQCDSDCLWNKALECADIAASTHLLLGIPSHVLAASALLVAITTTQKKGKEEISNLPQSIRQLLSLEDRTPLKLATCTIQELIEEKEQSLVGVRNNQNCSQLHSRTEQEDSSLIGDVKNHSTPRVLTEVRPLRKDSSSLEPNSKHCARTASTQATFSALTQDEVSLCVNSQNDFFSIEDENHLRTG